MLRVRHRLTLVLLTTTLLLLVSQLNLPKASGIQTIAGRTNSKSEVSYASELGAIPRPATNNLSSYWFKVIKQRDDKIKAKKLAHLRHVRAIRLALKQRAAIKTAQAAIPQSKPVYHHVSYSGNTYTPGQCTWGVKNWRPNIPNGWHNAYQWLYAAQGMGWATGATPRLNAVAWFKGGNHVALVISLHPLQIKEMNWNGPYSVHTREINASSWYYIY